MYFSFTNIVFSKLFERLARFEVRYNEWAVYSNEMNGRENQKYTLQLMIIRIVYEPNKPYINLVTITSGYYCYYYYSKEISEPDQY